MLIKYNISIDLQIYGDPEAADVVFTSGANIVVVGINITTQTKFTGGIALASLSQSSFSCIVLF